MPNIPCEHQIACPGTDDPITNYSSEAVDGVSFTAVVWPIPDDSPICASRNCPTPGCQHQPCITGPPSLYTVQGCLSTCTAVTLELAQLCAAQTAFICAHTGDDGGHPEFFYNAPQSCTIHCPDGSDFTWTVAAGSFVNLSQIAANNQAHQYACIQAQAHRICLSEIQTLCCIGAFCEATITAITNLSPVTLEISSGSLPPGWSLVDMGNGSAIIGGTAGSPGGDYTFTVKASVGNAEAFKTYTVTIFGIEEDTLADGTVGSAYSDFLTGSGGTTPYTFSLVSGSLPGDLTLNTATGEISGSDPQTQGTYDMTFGITDADGNHCTKDVTLTINAGCPDWTSLLWGAPTLVQPADGSASFNPNSLPGDTFNSTVTAPTSGGTASSAQNLGTLSYIGSGCNCNLHVDYATVQCAGQIVITANLIPVATFLFPATATSSVDVPFSIPAGIGVSIRVQPALQCAFLAGQAGQSSSYQAKITNI